MSGPDGWPMRLAGQFLPAFGAAFEHLDEHLSATPELPCCTCLPSPPPTRIDTNKDCAFAVLF
jgi:hypothetical protein